MINHVVLFKLKPFQPEEKASYILEIKGLLEGLKGKIEELRYIEVGTNYELETSGFDIALISHFRSVEELDRYRIHPDHVVVAKRMSELVEARAAVDYEFV
jgi:hypothetical protein